MVTINENNCIGCGACVSISDDIFDFDDIKGYAVVKQNLTDEILKENEDNITEAIESCPTDAIEKN